MRKLYAVLGLPLCLGGAVFAAEEGVQPAQEATIESKAAATGKGRIAELRADYAQGKFNSLLASLEADFAELQSSGRLKEFADMRQVPEAKEEMKEIAQQFEKLVLALIDERNAELNALCEGREQEITSQRVQSVTASLDEKQTEAMHFLASLRFKTPEQAATPEERVLIEIDLAHEFKSVHLDAQNSGVDMLEQQIVLSMDKVEKMRQAAESFEGSALKEKVLLAAKGFDAWQAKSLDLHELLVAAKKPSGDLDRKIGVVLAGYKAKKDDLYQKEFLAKLDS